MLPDQLIPGFLNPSGKPRVYALCFLPSSVYIQNTIRYDQAIVTCT